MPETSQDAFETKFPPKQPMSAEQIRIRSNSIKNRPTICVDNTLVAAESNFWPPSTNASGSSGQRSPRESRVSVGDDDSCYTAPEPIGYKRESSHR